MFYFDLIKGGMPDGYRRFVTWITDMKEENASKLRWLEIGTDMEAENLNGWSTPRAILCQSADKASFSSLYTVRDYLGPRSWV